MTCMVAGDKRTSAKAASSASEILRERRTGHKSKTAEQSARKQRAANIKK